MKNQTKISVIMSVFNPERKDLFFRAVNSIIHQTFTDWELILYDDGSEKESERLIRHVVKLDKRIFYIRNRKNRGLGYALNQCIHFSSGIYIARMDSDDLSKPDRFKKQYEFLETHLNYQWVGCNAELIDAHGVWGFQKMPKIPKRQDFLFNSPFVHPSVMFRKDVLVQNGGYLVSKRIMNCEDYELFMRLYKNGARGYNLQEPLLQYWEDYESHKKRTYKRRIREMKVRYHGFRQLGILNSTTFYYVLKPLLVGAIPPPLHHYIRKQTKQSKRFIRKEVAKNHDTESETV